MSIYPCIECDDEVRPRQQALQCDDYGWSHGLSDHMIDFCVKVFMALLEAKKKFFKLTKCPWVRNEYIPNEQHFTFFVRNGERFPLLLETNNTSRIFMVLSETTSALVIKISYVIAY